MIKVKQFIKQSHFEEALALCVHIQNETNTLQEMLKVESIPSKIIPLEHYMRNQQYWELESLRAYCLANIDRVSQAIERSQKCMKQMPRHSPTIRRLASYYEKVYLCIPSKGVQKRHSNCINWLKFINRIATTSRRRSSNCRANSTKIRVFS